jgi:hypothetical protein
MTRREDTSSRVAALWRAPWLLGAIVVLLLPSLVGITGVTLAGHAWLATLMGILFVLVCVLLVRAVGRAEDARRASPNEVGPGSLAVKMSGGDGGTGPVPLRYVWCDEARTRIMVYLSVEAADARRREVTRAGVEGQDITWNWDITFHRSGQVRPATLISERVRPEHEDVEMVFDLEGPTA